MGELLSLLRQYGKHPSSYLILEDDILHFKATDFPGVIGYEICAGVAFVIGEPIVADEHYEAFIRMFMKFCETKRLKICFCAITDQKKALYDRLGYRFQNYGLEALLTAEQFTLKGTAFAKVRWAVNKLTRMGYKVLEYTPDDHKDEVLENMIYAFSDDWHKKKMNLQLKFSLGELHFARNDGRRYFYIVDLFDIPQGIVTCLPYNQGKAYFIDVMRHHDNAPLGIMEKLIHDTFLLLQSDLVSELSLGLAPLAGLSEESASTGKTTNLLFNWIYHNGSSIYRFKSLYQFKKKFNPLWEKRYLVHYPPKVSVNFLFALGRLKVKDKLSTYMIKLIIVKFSQLRANFRLKSTERLFYFDANE